MYRDARASLFAFLGLAGILLAPGPVRAQPTFDLELLDGGRPVPGADIVFLTTGGKIPLGTTDTDGALDIAMDLVDIGKGQEVIAYEIECEGEIVIVFVLPDEVELFEEECELRRRENPACECRRIGVFVWGEGPVQIDVGDRVVRQPRPADGGLVLGGGFDLRQMFRLDDVVGMVDGVTDPDATAFAPGVQFLAEYEFRGILSLGVEGGWSPMETEYRIDGGMQTGELDYYEIGATARIGPRFNGDTILRPYVLLGLYRAWNKAEFSLDVARENRDHDTRRGGIGLGLDYYPRSPRFGFRFEGLYSSTFEDDDADEHVRWKFGLLYRPFTLQY